MFVKCTLILVLMVMMTLGYQDQDYYDYGEEYYHRPPAPGIGSRIRSFFRWIISPKTPTRTEKVTSLLPPPPKKHYGIVDKQGFALDPTEQLVLLGLTAAGVTTLAVSSGLVAGIVNFILGIFTPKTPDPFVSFDH